MTLHQLNILKAVVRTLSITKAAKELRISQPSISKQLRLLEEEYGMTFHTRIGPGIKLTEEGRLFWNAVSPILEQIDDLKRTFIATEHGRSLSVGASQSPSASLAPALLKVFGDGCPNVLAILKTADSRTLEQLLLTSDVEIALITLPSNHPHIIVEPFYTQKVTAFVSFRHPLAKKGKLRGDELLKVPFITKLGGRIEKLLKQHGCNFDVALQCESAGAVKSAVESGLGIGLLPHDNVAHGIKRGYFKAIHIPCLEEFDFECFVAYRKGVALSRNAQDFLALLRRWPEKRPKHLVTLA